MPGADDKSELCSMSARAPRLLPERGSPCRLAPCTAAATLQGAGGLRQAATAQGGGSEHRSARRGDGSVPGRTAGLLVPHHVELMPTAPTADLAGLSGGVCATNNVRRPCRSLRVRRWRGRGLCVFCCQTSRDKNNSVFILMWWEVTRMERVANAVPHEHSLHTMSSLITATCRAEVGALSLLLLGTLQLNPNDLVATTSAALKPPHPPPHTHTTNGCDTTQAFCRASKNDGGEPIMYGCNAGRWRSGKLLATFSRHMCRCSKEGRSEHWSRHC